jgi:phosphoserine/homoserine phosphotransferase
MKQSIVALDLEGVLTPEIWIAVAKKTGIDELLRTTRDEPDYDKLMQGRLAVLNRNGLKFSDIHRVIASLRPLDGARKFLDELRALVPVVILSGTFEEFAKPLLHQLGWPTLLCHRLHIQDGHIVDYRLRMPEHKKEAVTAFWKMNYSVVAVGDSYNDIAMLLAANTGIFFQAPENLRRQFHQFRAVETYADLMTLIKETIHENQKSQPPQLDLRQK